MEINTRNRSELKSYFVRNAIPTEGNFADLIDGMLNLKDDGIVKQSDSPLSLEAAGANETSEKSVIHFYQDFDSNTADWVFNLNPQVTVGDDTVARPGFNIADGARNSRLFIDQETGRVGLGTLEPNQELHIVAEGPNADLRLQQAGQEPTDLFSGANQAGLWSYGNKALLFGTNKTERLRITSDGNVGIGTTTPATKLDVNGNVKSGALTIGPWPASSSAYVFFGTNTLNQSNHDNYALLQESKSGSGRGRTFLNSPVDIQFRIKNSSKMVLNSQGNLSFGATTRQMLNLWREAYGIGVQNHTLYFRSDTNFAWFIDGSHHNNTYNPGSGGKRLMALSSAGDLILSARTNPTSASNKSLCRALVDGNNKLIINYGGDFASVETSKDFIVKGKAYKPGGGYWSNPSDLSLKKNVDSLGEALDKLLKLRGITFEWNNPENHDNLTGTQMGLIAQDVEKVFPEWVSPDPDGNKAITLVGFEALVIEAFRELNGKVEELSMKLVNLEQKLMVEA